MLPTAYPVPVLAPGASVPSVAVAVTFMFVTAEPVGCVMFPLESMLNPAVVLGVSRLQVIMPVLPAALTCVSMPEEACVCVVIVELLIMSAIVTSEVTEPVNGVEDESVAVTVTV